MFAPSRVAMSQNSSVSKILQPVSQSLKRDNLSLEPWTIDGGILTPTLKVKRQVLQRQFAKEIDQLYAGHQIPA
jgi:long-subunit acyl-CoA synthetase (AMP-forming)